MAVRIRLARHGTKKKPFYRIVVADTDHPRDGRHLEVVGLYDPKRKGTMIRLVHERLEHWLRVGARPTETVERLIKQFRKNQAKAA